MKHYALLPALLAPFITACALFGPTPQNAEEYRQATINKAADLTIDTYLVNRPYTAVVKVLEEKTKQCLTNTVTKENCVSTTSTTNCNERSFGFKPTFIKSQSKSELHVQMEQSNALFPGGEPPAGGMYITVIDVTPAVNKKTQIKVYSPTNYFKAVPKAVKHWVNGTNTGCPDFSQDF